MAPDTLEQLRSAFRGEIVGPEDPKYDEARKVYNAMIDRRPAIVARCANVADVINAVNFGRDNGLVIAVRGGGHSVPGFGTCDGGLVIDLGRMRGVRIDSKNRTAQAEGGCTWGDLNHAGYAFGLATPGGIVSTTGIAGLTLGGGIGYLSREFGLSCDNLLSADVVLADGSFVVCSEETEPDLFWAIRGGGGNFGIVASFEYRLHPVKDIFGGPTFFPLDPAVLRGFREWFAGAPRQLGGIFGLTLAEPLPFIRPEWHGKPAAAVLVCWTGPEAEGRELIKPFAKWAEIVGEYVVTMPYPTINTLFDELAPAGLQNYWKSNFVGELSDDAIAVHLQHAAKVPCVESGAFLLPVDGACHDVSPEATAFSYRDTAFSGIISGVWQSPADNDANIKWVRDYYEALRPFSEEGGYVNFASGDEQDRVPATYQQNYDRLAAAKKQYDPSNLFRLNQNIVPALSL